MKTPFPQFPKISGISFAHIPCSPGYAADSNGGIWSCQKTGKFRGYVAWHRLSPRTPRDGYPQVSLSVNGKRKTVKVARLVLLAFSGPLPDGYECAHFPDRNRQNNSVENLQYATRERNAMHRKVHGTQVHGSKIHCAKLTESNVVDVFERFSQGDRVADIASTYGVSTVTIRLLLARHTWKHVEIPGHLLIQRKPQTTAADLTDQKFGRLTPMSREGLSAGGNVIWLCKCECGNETRVASNMLKSRAIVSCGCWRREQCARVGKSRARWTKETSDAETHPDRSRD